MLRIISIFSIVILLFSHRARAQDVSQEINLICSGQTVVNESPQPTAFTNLDVSCLGDLPPYLSSNVVFYLVYISSGTTFTFEIDPSEDIDFDFGVWLNPDLEDLGAADRSSRNSPYSSSVFTTGLDLDDPETCEPTGSIGNFIPGKARYLDVQPGDRVLIAVDRWENIESGYTLTFGGDTGLDCSLVGGTFSICDSDMDGQETFDLTQFLPDLESEYPGASIDFYPNYSDALAGNGVGTISGEFAANSGQNILYARIEDNEGVLLNIKWFYFNVNPLPQTQEPSPIQICDYDGIGTAIFNITSVEDEMLLQGGLAVSYYANELDAQQENLLNSIVDPVNYNSAPATVYARVENIGGCFSVQPISLQLIDFTISPTIIYDGGCDNDNDGILSFNLYSYLPALDVQNPENFVITYFNSESSANSNDLIYAVSYPENYELFLGQSRIVYVRISIGECFIISEIHLETHAAIAINDVTQQYVCDENFDEIFITDLNEVQEEFSDTPEDFIFDYYTSIENVENNLPIGNPEIFVFDILPATIWVKVSNENGCSKIVAVSYDISLSVPFVTPDTAYLCENPDGSATINLNSYQSALTSLTSPVFLWFETYEDAVNQQDVISNSTNYQVTTATGTVYVRIRKRDYCPVIIPLNYQILIEANTILEGCDGDNDGEAIFDLTTSLPAFAIEDFDLNNIYYFENENAAINGDYGQIINNPAIYNGINGMVIYMRAELTGCFVINQIQLSVIQSPTISVSSTIQVCSGDSAIITPITNGQTIFWYATAIDPLPIFTGEAFETPPLTANTTYWVDTQNQQGCFSPRIAINIEVIPLSIPIFEQLLPICEGEWASLPTTSTNGFTGNWSPSFNSLETTTYTFTPNGGQCATTAQMTVQVLPNPTILATQVYEICSGNAAILTASTDGTAIQWFDSQTSTTPLFTGFNFTTPILQSNTTYWAGASNANCTSGRLPITVTVVETPTAAQIIQSADFSESNSVTILPDTPGNYVYQLDGNAIQDSNVFTNVSPGQHIITISNDCGSIEVNIEIIGYPKYFTPNGDGYNDYWNIIGLKQSAIVYIFDRYGKYLAEINTESFGWDGMYGNHSLPSTDYWFKVIYSDAFTGEVKEFSSHFSLKR